LIASPNFTSFVPGTRSDGLEQLAGLIERVTFHNGETGFAGPSSQSAGPACPRDGHRQAPESEGHNAARTRLEVGRPDGAW
jgi:hypothetical protein